MAKIKDVIYCDGCGLEITCQPHQVGRLVYCCEDCANGWICNCGERMEQEDEYRNPNPAVPV